MTQLGSQLHGKTHWGNHKTELSFKIKRKNIKRIKLHINQENITEKPVTKQKTRTKSKRVQITKTKQEIKSK